MAMNFFFIKKNSYAENFFKKKNFNQAKVFLKKKFIIFFLKNFLPARVYVQLKKFFECGVKQHRKIFYLARLKKNIFCWKNIFE